MKPKVEAYVESEVYKLENVIDTMKWMDSTIRAKSVEMSKMSDMIGERDKAIADLWVELKEARIKIDYWMSRARALEKGDGVHPIMPAPNDYHRLNGE